MLEASFLQAVIAAPQDDCTLLIYADWLEEQGEEAAAKCEFLRLTVARPTVKGRKKIRWRKRKQKRLQQLAARLETDWLCVVSRLRVEQCQQRYEGQPRLPAQVPCFRQWHELQTTAARTVRWCQNCRREVFYCDTITTARNHARVGRSVAVDLGVLRRDDDLLPEQALLLGRVRIYDDLFAADAVSAARELKKRAEIIARQSGNV
jgi:uncharacterized protein (TIGR02996 family)